METIYTTGIHLYCSYWEISTSLVVGALCCLLSGFFLLIYNVCVSFLSVCVHSGREQVSALVEKAVSGSSMGSLIYQPSGCGEQNMIHMTLPLIAATYLDKTNQWETVGFQKRAEALQHIRTGRLTDVFLVQIAESY